MGILLLKCVFISGTKLYYQLHTAIFYLCPLLLISELLMCLHVKFEIC